MYTNDHQEKLLQKIEEALGRNIATPKDYDFLSQEIYRVTQKHISTSTLKRLWGYIDTPFQPSRQTLNILAIFLGYNGYQSFLQYIEEGIDTSDFVNGTCIYSSSLQPNEQMVLRWLPNRMVTIKHEGGGWFSVVKSVNSKLCEGDTFQCHLFINHQPLHLSRLQRKGMQPCSYICGKEQGVKFEKIG